MPHKHKHKQKGPKYVDIYYVSNSEFNWLVGWVIYAPHNAKWFVIREWNEVQL